VFHFAQDKTAPALGEVTKVVHKLEAS